MSDVIWLEKLASSIFERENPKRREPGHKKPCFKRAKRAGNVFRLARSPEAPMTTTMALINGGGEGIAPTNEDVERVSRRENRSVDMRMESV